MAARHSGETTAPSFGSTLGDADTSALALNWLFPKSDGPTLDLLTLSGEAVIGRDEDCAVMLSGSDVSRRHASVRREGAVLLLSDLQSRNGTFVNGRRVRSIVLQNDDVVRVGGWIGVVTRLRGPLGSVAPGVFAGPALRKALAPAELAAQSDLPILLEGETGTGKEAVSRAIHGFSRRSGPFVAVNCAALPEALAEGELFGYRRGAFTGAEQASLGHFRAAQRGTLLLDEIGDLPLGVQAKLLRVLEQREVQPLGESTPVRLDVRVIAAAQSPLARAVQEGKFRADLYARLDGVCIRLPPLRERRAEIPYLFTRLLLQEGGGQVPNIDVRLMERLCLYDFPFNVRELSLTVKRLLVLHGSEPTLKVTHLPERMQGESSDAVPVVRQEPAKTAEPGAPDFDALLGALRASGGNVAKAAHALGISRQRAYRMMQARPELDLGALRDQDEEP